MIIFISCISCTNHQKENDLIIRNNKLIYENLDLKTENDSLRELIAENFLFENVGFKIIPSENTPQFNNKKFQGKILIYGYNEGDRIWINKKNKQNESTEDTIMNKSGMYNFSVNSSDTDEISLIIDLEFKKGSRTYDSIIYIPYRSLWLNN